MIRSRRCLIVLVGLAVLVGIGVPGPHAHADEPQARKQADERKWLIDRELTLSPQAAPRPALKYRLLPMVSERKPGNAVPIYLRLVHEQSDENRRRWVEMPTKWNKLPLDDLPLDRARKFLEAHRYMRRQLELGARRQKADWNYTLDAGDTIGLLLPDMNAMRGYVPLLVLQTRVALIDRDYGAAVRTLETGYSFSRQVAEGPFLINGLVGVAMASIFSDTILELVQRPGAPNLYWALTALPRPLIGMRKGEEFEHGLLKAQFPDMADLDRARTAEQWDEVLVRVRKEVRRITAFERGVKPQPPKPQPQEPASKSPDLETARKYLSEQRGLPAARVKEMPAAQVLVLWMADTFGDYRDDLFKASTLPYLKARVVQVAAQKRLTAAPDTEAVRLSRLLLPRLDKVSAAHNRLNRRIAALRVIEALRMHAAANDGRLPDKLGDVTVVPVPDDPGTGKPFSYLKDGAKATLTGTIPGEPGASNGLRYRLRVRAK